MIGAFRRRIEILASSRVGDGAGGASIAWSPVESLWAGVERLSSAPDVTGEASRRLKRIAASVRARSALAIGQRVVLDAEIYEIVSIESADDKERRLTLICEEVLP